MKSSNNHEKLLTCGIIILFLILTGIYLFPIFMGLIALPLDLLVSRYGPWHAESTILLKNSWLQDSIIQMFPWKYMTYQSLRHFIIPLWNPYQLMGMPFAAGMKPMVYYPLNFLMALPTVVWWNSLVFAQIFLALIFMYLFIRSFKLPVIPSILTALTFGLNTFMVSVLSYGSEGHVVLWLPLSLYAAKKYLDNGNRKFIPVLGFSVAAAVLAGQIQHFAYEFILILAFILAYGISKKTKWKSYIMLFMGILLGFGVTIVQMLPALELTKYSARFNTVLLSSFRDALIKPFQYLRLFAPDYFGNPVTLDQAVNYTEHSGYFGLIALYFALYAMFFRAGKTVKFFTGIFAAGLLFSETHIGTLISNLPLPVIFSGSGDRIFTLVYSSGAILAGFGMESFINEKYKKRQLISLTLFILVTLTAFGVQKYVSGLTGGFDLYARNLKFALMVMSAFGVSIILYIFNSKHKYVPVIFSVILLAITFVDLFRIGYRFNTFSNPKFLYPDTDNVVYMRKNTARDLSRVYGITEPEVDGVLKLQSIETYNPLFLTRSADLLTALEQTPNYDHTQAKLFLTGKAPAKKFTLDFLGVKYVNVGKDVNPSIGIFGTPDFQSSFQKVYTSASDTVYQNSDAFPRFGLFYKDLVELDDTKTLEHIRNRDVDFRNTVLVNQPINLPLTIGTGSAELVSDDMNTLKFRLNSTSPAIFYLSDTFFPGWTARINGVKAEILRANYNFRGIVIPQGKSEVTFSYVPTDFNVAVGISLISLVLLAIFMI